MPRSDRAEAGQGLLERLVTVLVIIAGLVVLITPLCGDGRSMTPVYEGSAARATDSGRHVGPMAGGSEDPCQTITVADRSGVRRGVASVDLAPSPVGAALPGGALLACIAFVVAVLAVILRLRPPSSAGAAASAQENSPTRPAAHPGRTPYGRRDVLVPGSTKVP